MGYTNPGAPAESETNDHPGRQVFFLDGELPLLAQDRILLESAQPWLEADKGEYERSVPADVAPLMARNLVASVLRAEGKDPKREPQRRVFRCTC